MKFITRFITLFILTLVSTSSLSQTISGKVYDRSTGYPLPGVTILVKGTTIGSMTDTLGAYTIDIPRGDYYLLVRYMSYKDQTIVISINLSNVVKNIYLDESSTGLNEVEIRSEAKKETESSINIERKNASVVSDGVSSEQFKKTPDKNASDILKRVSGTSIQENKFAIIRGMNDRYNSTFLNGSPLPSTESDRKAFSFNMIPSNIIDNIMIYKSPAPNISGEFAGGIISIVTKGIPTSRISSLDISIGYNSISTGINFRSFRTSKTDIFGFDDGTRLPPDSKIHNSQLTKSENIDLTKSFNNDWRIYDKKSLPNGSISYCFGNIFKLNHRRTFGFISSISYSNSNKFNKSDQNKFRYEDNLLDQHFIDSQYTNSISMGSLFNMGYKSKGNTITMKNMFNLNSDNITTLRSGLGSGENGIYIRSNSNMYSQNRIISSQISGDHVISKSKINWNLNIGDVLKLVPDYRISSYGGEGNDPSLYTLAVNNNLFSSSVGRFYSTMSEKIYSASADYTKKFDLSITKNELKIGFISQHRYRDFKSRSFTYYGRYGITGTQEENLSESNIGENGVYMVEQTSPARDNYDALSNLNAMYLMNDTKISKIRMVYGVRYERYYQKVNTSDGSNLPLIIDSTYVNFLPSVNFIYNVNTKSNLRVSSGKTVNRPEFRELAMFPFYNFNMNSNIAGNPNLQPSKIWNYDLRYEFFPSPKEVISVGIFYKKITNPIELAIDVTQVAIRTFGYSNQKLANNYGLELEYKKSFGFITKHTGYKFWEKLSIFTNLSLIKSEIKFNKLSAIEDGRPLQGQSNFILNSGIQFDDKKSGVGININYNKIGRRISFVGAPKLAKYGLDVWENPRDVIDIQLSKTTKRLTYKLTAGDILSQNLIFYQDVDKNKRYTKEDNMIFSYTMGKTISMSVSIKFYK